MQVTATALSIHEASEILREEVARRLGIQPGELLQLDVCSYGQARLTIQFDRPGGSHRWEQHRELMHLTHGGTV